MKKKLPLIVLFLLAIFSVSGQDIHFSQFYASPININPANTGAFLGDYRFCNTYRSQWSSLGTPYSTISASFDIKALKRKLNGNYFAIGVQVNRDMAGDIKMGTLQALLSLTFNKSLNPEKNHFISAGFSEGVTQHSIDFNSATWDSQWDGDMYNPIFPSREASVNQSFFTTDLSAGVQWHYQPDESYRFTAGLGFFHLNQPLISFTNFTEEQQYRRITFNAMTHIQMSNSNIYLVPSFLWSTQGPSKEWELGTFMMYIVQSRSRYTKFRGEVDIHLGLWLRKGDALIPAIRFGFRNFALGFSYDVNFSKLNEATNSMGGMEITLIYANRITKSHFRRAAPKATRFL